MGLFGPSYVSPIPQPKQPSIFQRLKDWAGGLLESKPPIPASPGGQFQKEDPLTKQGWTKTGEGTYTKNGATIRPANATPTPTMAPSKSGIPNTPSRAMVQPVAPKPTVTPIPNTPQNPYLGLIKETWPGVDPMKVSNVMFGESSFRPNIIHYNDNRAKPHEMVTNRDQWLNARRSSPSVDVGLMQINTAKAMTDYLIKKGWTYYDLINDPRKNLMAAYDLYRGAIPGTAPGWGNWYAARGLGYQNKE